MPLTASSRADRHSRHHSLATPGERDSYAATNGIADPASDRDSDVHADSYSNSDSNSDAYSRSDRRCHDLQMGHDRLHLRCYGKLDQR
jgi:hypothetical protein